MIPAIFHAVYVVRYLLCLSLLLSLPFASLQSFAAQNLRILLTNDDGFESPGIKALQQALRREGHDVFVIAPVSQQSGKSAAVTARGVRFKAHPGQVWSVEGTPADAVRLGLGYVMYNHPPDLVVSGANFGQNTGQDVHISGTVGAALTAHRLGIPAVAVSVAIKLDEAERGFPSTIGALRGAARVTARLIRNMNLSDMTAVLNVNYPAALPLDVKGVRWSPLSQHSIIGTRYYRQPDGSYAPELQEPHPNARAYDAESVLDDYVTLTFLDGDTATAPQRSQRYLARDLMDQSYEPTVQTPTHTPPQTPQSQPIAIRRAPVQQPAPEEPSVQTLVKEEPPAPVQRAASPPGETQVPALKPNNPVIKLGTEKQAALPRPETTPAPQRRISVREEVITIPDSAPPVRQTTSRSSAPDLAPPQDQLPPPSPESEQADDPEAETPTETQTEVKKEKPDSWLRRMFDPGSWRR